MCPSTLHPSIKFFASFLARPIWLRVGETNGISENSKSLDDALFVLLLIISQHLLTLVDKQRAAARHFKCLVCIQHRGIVSFNQHKDKQNLKKIPLAL